MHSCIKASLSDLCLVVMTVFHTNPMMSAEMVFQFFQFRKLGFQIVHDELRGAWKAVMVADGN